MTKPIPPRLKWACRRGMLEMDLWLERFLQEGWQGLSEADQGVFEAMLQEADPVLYHWLTLQERPADPKVCAIIDQIRSYVMC